MIGEALCLAGLAVGALTMARPRVLPRPRGASGQPAAVSVVIPARNEAATLPALLQSLQGSRGIVREILVVDDRSADSTASVAAALGATVVPLDGEPPPGWTGKNRACALGASVATSPILLFLDADVRMTDDGVARLLAAYEDRGGLVSVQPYHAVSALYEELSAGCNLVSMMGSGAFAAWSTGDTPAAFGPCLMTSRDDYLAIGGHESVRSDVVEDIALARRYRAHDLPVTVHLGTDAVSFRMYPGGLGKLVEGWTKNLAGGSRAAHAWSAIAAAAWLTASLTIGVHGIAVASRIRTAGPADAVIALIGWLLVSAHMLWLLRRIGSFRVTTALFHPVALWWFVGLFLRSAWHTYVRRSVRWSDREIDLRGPRAG